MAKRMAQVLASPAWQTPLPVPTVDRTDPRWRSDRFWRGDVWPPTNYQIASGLAEYGHTKLAADIVDKTIANAIKNGISEHYDSVSGRPLGVRDYCMSSTLVLMMLDNLTRREQLLGDLVPWENANFGTDEYWLSSYPYEQTAAPGETLGCEVRIMNHADGMRDAVILPMAPENWEAEPAILQAPCPARQESSLTFRMTVPQNAPEGRYVIPIRIEFGGIQLGSRVETIVVVE